VVVVGSAFFLKSLKQPLFFPHPGPPKVGWAASSPKNLSPPPKSCSTRPVVKFFFSPPWGSHFPAVFSGRLWGPNSLEFFVESSISTPGFTKNPLTFNVPILPHPNFEYVNFFFRVWLFFSRGFLGLGVPFGPVVFPIPFGGICPAFLSKRLTTRCTGCVLFSLRPSFSFHLSSFSLSLWAVTF